MVVPTDQIQQDSIVPRYSIVLRLQSISYMRGS